MKFSLEELSIFELENEPIVETKIVKLYPIRGSNDIKKSKFYREVISLFDDNEIFSKFYSSGLMKMILSDSFDNSELSVLDGGRSAIFIRYKIRTSKEDFFISKKGVGYLSRLSQIRTSNQEIKNTINSLIEKNYEEDLVFTPEDMGYNRPLGLQSYDLGEISIHDTNRLRNDFSFYGAYFSPVISMIRPLRKLKEAVYEMRIFNNYHDSDKKPIPYKKFKPVQITRLLPSNIRPISFYDRVYSESFGIPVIRSLEEFKNRFEVNSEREARRFLRNLVSSYAALLSLPTRVGQKSGNFYSFFTFDNVNIGKDSVISKRGNLYFVDLEGVYLDKYPGSIFLTESSAKKEMMRQIKLNILPLDRFFSKIFSFVFDERIDEENSVDVLKKYFREKQDTVDIDCDRGGYTIYVNSLFDISFTLSFNFNYP